MFDPSDPFDPMSPFFQDEFIFNDENDQTGRRQQPSGDDCSQPCPDCGNTLRYPAGAETVRCGNCGSRFRIN